MSDSDQKRNDNDDNGDHMEWAARPKFKRANKSNFIVNDKVYLKIGSTLTGPYYVAKVCRIKVYTLCDESGEDVNDGLEVGEDSLQRG
ncbi:hypothetical protein F5Y04DRAFT_260030 [Hypomontagnella monticulosa]|nr:hypothetical protein F5Y04DRAFT_260030 [Hypomontagnella monticulosa]